MILKKEDLSKVKLLRISNTEFSFDFELFPNKINAYINRFCDIYFNEKIYNDYENML